MNKLNTSLLVVLVLISSHLLCAQEKKKQNIFKQLFGVSVQETSDKFEGTTTYHMHGNTVFSELSGGNAVMNLVFGSERVTFTTFLNLEKHVLKDDTVELSILFKVEADNELFVRIMEGESLIFLLDGNRLGLSTRGSFNTDYDMMDESSVASARFAITEEQLKKINASEKIDFRIILDSPQLGKAEERDKKDQHLDGRFNKRNKKAWIEFAADYLNE